MLIVFRPSFEMVKEGRISIKMGVFDQKNQTELSFKYEHTMECAFHSIIRVMCW